MEMAARILIHNVRMLIMVVRLLVAVLLLLLGGLDFLVFHLFLFVAFTTGLLGFSIKDSMKLIFTFHTLNAFIHALKCTGNVDHECRIAVDANLEENFKISKNIFIFKRKKLNLKTKKTDLYRNMLRQSSPVHLFLWQLVALSSTSFVDSGTKFWFDVRLSTMHEQFQFVAFVSNSD